MYHLISKTVLIKVLQSINNNKIKRERERGRERENDPIRKCRSYSHKRRRGDKNAIKRRFQKLI